MKPIRVFVSHSSDDIEMAMDMKEAMMYLRIKPFLAHSDIEVGESWRDAIRNEITKCDILVPLVTPKFRESEYTEQEIGAAWVLKKPILPVLADGEKPTGFITEKQGVKYDKEFSGNTACSILKFALSEIHCKERVAAMLVERLVASPSWREANCLISCLESEKTLTEEQVEAMDKVLESGYLDKAFKKKHLRQLISKHKAKLDG